MRALALTGPRLAVVQEVAEPRAGRLDVVVAVHLVGVCGTDHELYSGDMAYLHSGRARYPLRPGHEWSGVVGEVGDGHFGRPARPVSRALDPARSPPDPRPRPTADVGRRP